MTLNKRLVTTFSAALLFCVYFFLPWPHTISFNAVVVPVKEQILWAPSAGVVRQIHAVRNQNVTKGEELVVLESLMLKPALSQAGLEKDLLDRKILQLGLKGDTAQYLSQAEGELALAMEREAKLQSEQNMMHIRSAIDGQLYDWDIDLKVDQNIQQGMILGKIADFSSYVAKAFVSEDQVGNFKTGQEVTVQIDHPLMFLKGKVLAISPYSSAEIHYPSLASVNFGPLAVVNDPQGRLRLLDSYFVVTVEIEDKANELNPSFRIGQTGKVATRGPWVSIAADLFRRATQILIRESSL